MPNDDQPWFVSVFLSPTWRLLGEGVLSLVAALIAGFVIADAGTGLAFGLLLFFVMSIGELRVQLNEISKEHRAGAALADLLGAPPGLPRIRAEWARRTLRRFGGTIKVTREDAHDFWRACIRNTDASWHVVSYVLPSEYWDQEWRSALGDQQERIHHDCSFERVFLLDSLAELPPLAKTIKRQREIGVTVGWVLKAELPRQACAYFQRLGTWDVALVDAQWVHRTHLDAERCVVYASATDAHGVVEDARELFRHARVRAQPTFHSEPR